MAEVGATEPQKNLAVAPVETVHSFPKTESRSPKDVSIEELDAIERTLESHPFKTSPQLANRHTQTVASVFTPNFGEKAFPLGIVRPEYAWPGTRRELVPLQDGGKIAIEYNLQKDPENHPTIIVVPGYVASSGSTYAMGIGRKAFHYGFNVVRMNLRNQGGTEALTKTLYFGDQSTDVVDVLKYVHEHGIGHDTLRMARNNVPPLEEPVKLKDIYFAAFSLGGNILLKALGELGDGAKKYDVKGAATLSGVVDPLASIKYLEGHAENKMYVARIADALKSMVKTKAKTDPQSWDTTDIKKIKTLSQFDIRYQIPQGYTLEQFYNLGSALPHVPDITVPTLVIAAEDDPMVPVSPLKGPEFANNKNVRRIITEKGGHTGYVQDKKRYGDLDLHWDQNRAVEFFRLLQKAYQKKAAQTAPTT
ncbi:MAG TPA: alpha/beta fold hydrolase [Candidatus Saccharimonadales bacterium]|nr:alpha/beta fold hydrolase [Candidatus Saccharimonadales bacterium]